MTAPRLHVEREEPVEPQDFGAVETPVDSFTDQDTSVPSRLSGDDVPEPYRDKTINDVFKEMERLQNTAKINEEMIRRLAAEPPKPQVVEVRREADRAPVAESQQITDEQLEEMVASDDPKMRMQAFRLMQDRNNIALAHALERRLGPLANSTLSAAEQAARSKYPLEFEIFDKEIAEVRAMVDPSNLSTPQAWDELMNQVRGRDPRKYVEALQKRDGVTSLASAQARETIDRPFVPPTRSVPSNGRSPSRLDELQRKIARDFNMTDEEYIHFDSTGAQI